MKLYDDMEKETKKAEAAAGEGAAVSAAKNAGALSGGAVPKAENPNRNSQYEGMYNPGTDYQAEINKSVASGDFGRAATLERVRNYKIMGEGMRNPLTHNWHYNEDAARYDLEKKYEQYATQQGFSYDPLKDESYKAIRAQKEAEADKAYKDAYARAAAQNGGEVPADMLAQLETIRSNILNSADAQIPALKQLAYDMYLSDRDKLYREYAMLKDEQDTDRASYERNREWFADSYNNEYARRYADARDKAADEYRDRSFNESVRQADRNFEESARQFDYQRYLNERQLSDDKKSKILTMALALADKYGYAKAMELAAKYYGGEDFEIGEMQGAGGTASYAGSGSGRSGKKSAVSVPSSESRESAPEYGAVYIDENGNIKKK